MEERAFHSLSADVEDDLQFIRVMTRETPTRAVLDVLHRHPNGVQTVSSISAAYTARIHELFPEVDGLEREIRTCYASGSTPPSWDDLPGFFIIWMWSQLTSDPSKQFRDWVTRAYAAPILTVFNVPRRRV